MLVMVKQQQERRHCTERLVLHSCACVDVAHLTSVHVMSGDLRCYCTTAACMHSAIVPSETTTMSVQVSENESSISKGLPVFSSPAWHQSMQLLTVQHAVD